MAGGKLTPRQKMINLMYLVFIAMLALNMSKEVLSAFGLMNEKFESANKTSLSTNNIMLNQIDKKAAEDAGHYSEASKNAHKIESITKAFYAYIEKLKNDAVLGIEIDSKTGKLPYESMDKASTIDESWFSSDGYSKKGNEIIATIQKYKSDMKLILGSDSKLKSIITEVEEKFNVNDVKDREGISKKYLQYNFEHFPLIASLAKLTAFQNDVKKTESDIYTRLLGNAALDESSMKNFTAIIALDKNVYFEGEAVTGKVVIGKYDENTHPTSFTGPGKIVKGQLLISQTAGSVGEHDLVGQFTFIQDGATIPLKYAGKYVVVARPKSANISADKMNVVYRGVANPMTISFAGVSNNDVKASAPGLSQIGSLGTYTMNPQGGTEVTINVNAKLPDGKTVSDAKVFRIKNIPGPMGGIGGDTGLIKGAKSRLEVSQISAVLKDFPFDLTFAVKQFAFKVPGQATIIVNGDRVNAQCKSALARASKGDQVTISDIKTIIPNSQVVTPKTSPVIYEIQ